MLQLEADMNFSSGWASILAPVDVVPPWVTAATHGRGRSYLRGRNVVISAWIV